MAKVLIQEGVARYSHSTLNQSSPSSITNTETFRTSLESQQSKRLRGAPKRLKFYRQ